jgi:hypothetical protein
MFDSVDEMVEENDRRQLEDDDQPTLEYAFASPANASYIRLCKSAKTACTEAMGFLLSTSQI